ncbi:NAD(P)-dependent oxidoreductase [Novosphingobium sp. PP1Y]|uniref:NAD(P)-dependent oxidoreductase n=1 Tax=Novosphingobium sp. PP1Y TaxID=702113 RepID=UPI00020EFACD|nr:NAD(P)-dependent oxidoreductase [Novosphingobium sp. PP1Y]CCA90018.1 2-hydroxy-3-oxopropionate reductase [Novosphingobium sp. PP1Y]
MKLGVIGLGTMGRPIAHHLYRPTDTLTVSSQNTEVFEEFTTKGIAASTDVTICRDSDIIFICVPDGEIVKDILFGSGGLAATVRPGTLIVDLSTVVYQDALEVAARLADMQINFLDAPVSGMEKRANEGTLTIMAGGEKDLFEKAKPYLERIGTKVLHMGKVGNGQLMKMTNQLVYDTNIAALAEVVPMAVKIGLDPVQIVEVINTGTGRSYASEYFLPHILDEIFDTSYTLKGAYKDIISAHKISADHNIPMPVISAMTAVYQTALREGHGSKDKGAMILVFEKLLGIKVRRDK